MAWVERLKKYFRELTDSKITPKLLLLLLLGIALLSFNSCFDTGTRNRDREGALNGAIAGAPEGAAAESSLEKELETMLEQINGVNHVSVYITLESSGRQELVVDQEHTEKQTVEGDGSGVQREIGEVTRRETHVILRDAQGRELPLVVAESQPCYRGAMVIAGGVEDPAVKAQVVEALRAVLDLPYHRITVLPRG
ncbi:MAG: hypothetical protein GX044_10085 [Firmicutes bacterium]|jgi:stage III sporulation protein AG|nr:hypothetical protein [Bacillota bacterium]